MSKQNLQLGCIGTSFSRDSPGNRGIKFILPELQQVPTVSSEIRSTFLPVHALPTIVVLDSFFRLKVSLSASNPYHQYFALHY
jgi:hypothetical protein